MLLICLTTYLTQIKTQFNKKTNLNPHAYVLYNVYNFIIRHYMHVHCRIHEHGQYVSTIWYILSIYTVHILKYILRIVPSWQPYIPLLYYKESHLTSNLSKKKKPFDKSNTPPRKNYDRLLWANWVMLPILICYLDSCKFFLYF